MSTTSESVLEWTGDLEDDCVLRHGDYLAHAECLGEFTAMFSDGPTQLEYWFCAVYRGPDVLYHSSEAGGMICGGEQCRAICEAIIRAAMKQHAGTIPQ